MTLYAFLAAPLVCLMLAICVGCLWLWNTKDPRVRARPLFPWVPLVVTVLGFFADLGIVWTLDVLARWLHP